MGSKPQKPAIYQNQVCEVCGSNLVNFKCKKCCLDYIELNLARSIAYLSYAGNCMQTHSTILLAIIIGLTTLTPTFLTIDSIRLAIFIFIIIVCFEIFGYYEVHKYVKYRKEGKKHEQLL